MSVILYYRRGWVNKDSKCRALDNNLQRTEARQHSIAEVSIYNIDDRRKLLQERHTLTEILEREYSKNSTHKLERAGKIIMTDITVQTQYVHQLSQKVHHSISLQEK